MLTTGPQRNLPIQLRGGIGPGLEDCFFHHGTTFADGNHFPRDFMGNLQGNLGIFGVVKLNFAPDPDKRIFPVLEIDSPLDPFKLDFIGFNPIAGSIITRISPLWLRAM